MGGIAVFVGQADSVVGTSGETLQSRAASVGDNAAMQPALIASSVNFVSEFTAYINVSSCFRSGRFPYP